MRQPTRTTGILVLAVAPFIFAARPAPGQGKLYFTHYRFNDPLLQSMNLDGSDVEDLFAPGNPFPASDWLPVGLAVDSAAGRIYWIHGSTPGLIRRANPDGSDPELLISGLKIPRGVAVDTLAGKMYWTASPPQGNASGLVRRANLDGTDLETVFAVEPYDPVSSKVGRPTVDPVNGYVYFGTDGVIKRVNLDGPPFKAQTIATGGSTITRVQLDVARGHIYWIDSNTISDCLLRVNPDNTGFTVLVDSTPDFGGSSGLIDLVLDSPGGKMYWADEIGNKGVFRADLDGSGDEMIHASPEGYNASALVFDVQTPQPMTDCNENGARDLDDITNGTSDDCNNNGVPDECELNPCAPAGHLLDQGLNTEAAGRSLGGTAPGTGWIVFQPFDVPQGGWEIGGFSLNGVTWNYHPDGFTATVFPDNGADYPDESQPLATGATFFRFGPTWVPEPMRVTLPAGRHWLRLTANASYVAAVFVGTGGLPSLSRSNLGNDFPNQPPIALRILMDAAGDLDGDGDVDLFDFAGMSTCQSGPQGGVAAGCEPFNFDGDDDVDWADFGEFQRVFTGQ